MRREDEAVKQVQRLQAELAALQDLLTANQKELQRNQMVMKFRNAEVERRRVSAPPGRSCACMWCPEVTGFGILYTVNSLCNGCLHYQKICPYIKLSLLGGTTAVRMQ